MPTVGLAFVRQEHATSLAMFSFRLQFLDCSFVRTTAEVSTSECRDARNLGSSGTDQERQDEEESESDQANQAKYHRGSSKGNQSQQGKGQRGWTDSKDLWSSWQNKDWQKASTQKEEVEELKEMVKILTKLALKHDDESSRLCSETGFMLCLDTDSKGITADLLEVSSKWKELRVINQVTSSLKVTLSLSILKELTSRLQMAVCTDTVRDKMVSNGWAHLGEQPLDPVWTYLEWNRAKKATDIAKKTPLKHSELMDLLTAPSNKAHGPVVPIGGPALPHVHRTSERRGQQSLLYIAVGRSFGSAFDRIEAAAGKTSAPANGKGVGGDLLEIPDLRLGTKGGYPQDSEARAQGNGDGTEPGGERLTCRGPQRTLTATLLNHGNHCYVNSCAIGLHWLGECTGAADEVYGSAKPGLLLLRRSVAVSLASALSWLPILQRWQDVDSQHDAAEFFTFLIEQAGPVAFNGIWESRTVEAGHMRIFDSGPLSVPIPLPIAGSSLQSCVDEWENQATPHALRFDHGILILQLRRYAL